MADPLPISMAFSLFSSILHDVYMSDNIELTARLDLL